MQENNSLLTPFILGEKIQDLDKRRYHGIKMIREKDYILQGDLGFYHGKPLVRIGFYTDSDNRIVSIN